MSTITFEQATTVAKSLLDAVASIEAREKESRAAAARLSAVESAAREAESRRQNAHAECAGVETKIIEQRRELETLTAQADNAYTRRVAEEGRLNAIQSQLVEVRQKLGA